MDPLFQVLVQNSSDAVAMLDADGTIRFLSDSAARLLGYSLGERITRSAIELMHPDDAPRARDSFVECLRRPGVPLAAEYRLRHKDGSWRNLEGIAVNRLDHPAIAAVVVNYRDVTDRRLAEEALRASEEHLRHIVENAQDLIYYCDREGRFTYVNPTAARVMQYAEHELIGRHFLSLVRPDYQQAAGDVYQRQMLDRTPTTYLELPAVTKTGQTIWVGQHVQLVYEGERVTAIHAITRDISRQKDADDRLRKSEARYRSLIQGAAYGIYRATVDGTILDANPALANMLGYTVDELLALDMSAVYKSSAERGALIDRYRRENNQTLATDVTWQRKDGTPIVVRLTARVVDFDDGLSCFEGVAEDITEKRALEDQLREALKMEALGRLARRVAHDFNNVLAAIIGCSDLLCMSLKPDDPSRHESDEIRRAALRGAALTRQLLAFSRSQMPDAKLLDLNEAVLRLESIMRGLVGERVSLTVRVPSTPTRVRVEPGQLEQMLLNLVVNARDAMPEGGPIDVLVEPVRLDERSVLRYPGIADGPFARLAVTDTGVGIDPDVEAHIFEPLFTTKDASKGTGLGLSIVYGIAKAAGGTVSFTTGPTQGTTFEVLLPLVEAMANKMADG
ncbi:MAG: hypothetical protein DMF94_25935 [Acidobacteria bacterium]|nr:MAG: hypothetical protein DMF94_25935 [Acidobacteriota bacterium]